MERWKPIPGYEHKYQVSACGGVRSVDHYVRLVAHGKETQRLVPGKTLKPGRSTSGHLTVCLGKGNTHGVHRLVASAFLGACPAGKEVLHLDGDPSNNRLENLRYGTRSENLKMDYAAGVRRTPANFIGARWRA